MTSAVARLTAGSPAMSAVLAFADVAEVVTAPA
jgi:hypothetical protein